MALTYNDRIRIELLYNREKNNPKAIAEKIGVSERTIFREIKRGYCETLDTQLVVKKEYSADVAQKDYRKKVSKRGAGLKIGRDYALAAYIENKMIQHKYSPAAVLYEIRNKGLQFSVEISRTTLYNYINDNVFLALSNKHLPYGKRKKNKAAEKRRIAYKDPMKESIEDRPKEIQKRNEFGHWEMDTVYSKKQDGNACLLVLTERKTRKEITEKMQARTAQNVVKALDKIERELSRQKAHFKDIFKTITADNGSEFADVTGIESSYYKGRNQRTKIYFCHPFCSYERGSNENSNKLIRRFIPKGTKISRYTHKEIQEITDWINEYPRGIFDGYPSNDIAFRDGINFSL